MSTPHITTVFTDIGGVLLTNGWDRKARKLACETFDLDYEEVNERHHLTFDTYEEGKLSLDEYLARVVFYEAKPFSVDDFKAFMFERSQPFPEMIDPVTKKMRTRLVDISGETYEVARRYMIRLEQSDFDDPARLERLAGVVKLTPAQFRERFEYIVR